MHRNFQQVFVLLLAFPRFLNLIEYYHFYLYKIVWLQMLFPSFVFMQQERDLLNPNSSPWIHSPLV